MPSSMHIREIILFGASLLLAFFLFTKNGDNTKLKEDKVRAEERVKEYEQIFKAQEKITDSLKIKASSLESIIEYQKKNPAIIIQKYDKAISNINLLDADQSISFLSNRLSKESGHR